MDWLRWYLGTCTDAKLHRASRIAGCRRAIVIAAWAAMLEEARRGDGSGAFGTTPDADWLAYQIDWPKPNCQRVMNAMIEVNLITRNEAPRFPVRQFSSDSSTTRVRAFRAKSLNSLAAAPPGNVSETHQNRTEQNRVVSIPPAPSEHPPHGGDPKANGSAKPKSRPVGARLAEDWRPSSEAVAHCQQELGCGTSLLKAEFPNFQCHFLASTGTTARKVDWDRTFINWMRRARRDEIRFEQSRDRRQQRSGGA